MEDMILFGEPVKALGGGKVGGYLVRFTDAQKRDLTKQYFSSKSYLGPADGDGGECLFEHGMSLKHDAMARGVKDTDALKLFDALADLTFTPLKTKRDKLGIWAQTVLDISDDYQKMVYEMAEAGKLGWSSGSAGHRIKIASDGHIERWPIIEGSLTPRPCMPMDTCVMPMKQYVESYADAIKSFFQVSNDEPPKSAASITPTKISTTLKQYLDDLVDSGRDRENILAEISHQTGLSAKAVLDVLEGREKPTAAKLKGFARALEVDESLLVGSFNLSPKTIKGMFEDELAERTPSVWELWNAYCCVTQKLAMAAVSTQATGVEFDLQAKVDESTDEYVGRLKAQVMAQIASYTEAGSMDEPFYLKAIINLLEGDLLSAKHLNLDEHSELVASAFEGILQRFDGHYQNRTKAGREFSEKNRNQLSAFLGRIKEAATAAEELLEKSKPMAKSADIQAAQTRFLRTKWNARKSGV